MYANKNIIYISFLIFVFLENGLSLSIVFVKNVSFVFGDFNRCEMYTV